MQHRSITLKQHRGATVIEVSGQIELDEYGNCDRQIKKYVSEPLDAVTISKNKQDTLTADMFQVSGENAELQFDVKEGAEECFTHSFRYAL